MNKCFWTFAAALLGVMMFAACEREVPVPVDEAGTRSGVDSTGRFSLHLTVDTAWAGEDFYEY